MSHEILHLHVEKLQEYLKRELEIEQERLLEKIFDKTLEQIFIENRLYKKIEEVKSYEAIHETIENSLMPFHKQLMRIPTQEDREKLLSIPIRRISRFDLDKNHEEIADIQVEIGKIEKDLKNVKKFTINYLRDLLGKYGAHYPRRTRLQQIEQIDMRAIATRNVKIGFDPETGFVGTKVSGPQQFECTNFDKLLLLFKDGSYTVINIPEKQYVQKEGQKLVHMGVADKKTVLTAVYKNPKTLHVYAKRFVVEKFILEKIYRFLEEGMLLEVLTSDPAPVVELRFIPKVKQKSSEMTCKLQDVLVKGVTAHGIRLTPREVKKVILLGAKK